MSRVLSFLLVLSALAVLSSAVVSRYPQASIVPDIENKHILVFKSDVTAEQKRMYVETLEKNFALKTDSRIKHEVIDHFEIGSFSGIVFRASDFFVASASAHPFVKYIQKDGIVKAADVVKCQDQEAVEWGLNRVAERVLDLDGTYEYQADGSGVDAYVIDTGILTTHEEFEGRAVWGATFTNDGKNQDCNGHGTHVSGTIGGKTYGIAKKINLIAVKVLDCGGSGSWSGVVGGVNWVAQQHKKSGRPSVANMSLGGGATQILDDAIEALVQAGVVTVVAAGNSNEDACYSSPARVKTAITVGATTVEDYRASFSNYGTCTDIFAPGAGILSAWIDSTTSTKFLSGTSMASPHVCGAAALVLDANRNATVADIKDYLTTVATPDVLDLKCGSSSVCPKSPNLLLYSACDN